MTRTFAVLTLLALSATVAGVTATPEPPPLAEPFDYWAIYRIRSEWFSGFMGASVTQIPDLLAVKDGEMYDGAFGINVMRSGHRSDSWTVWKGK